MIMGQKTILSEDSMIRGYETTWVYKGERQNKKIQSGGGDGWKIIPKYAGITQ